MKAGSSGLTGGKNPYVFPASSFCLSSVSFQSNLIIVCLQDANAWFRTGDLREEGGGDLKDHFPLENFDYPESQNAFLRAFQHFKHLIIIMMIA